MASILTDEELFQNRNSKEVHDWKLQNWKSSHDRVCEDAVRALHFHNLSIETEQTKKLVDDKLRAVALAEEKAEAEIRLREAENAAKRIPRPPPRLPTPPPAPPVEKLPPPPPPKKTPPPAAPALVPISKIVQAPTVVPEPPRIAQQLPKSNTSLAQAEPVVHSPPVQRQTPVDPTIAKLDEIHASCKKLRAYIKTLPNESVKIAGNMRRKIKMTIGQLVETGGNKHQTDALREVLNTALRYGEDSVDPRLFMIARPEQQPGAKHNGERMSTLFVYLVNILSKAIISQLINEASAKPAAAEPIGVIAHQIFSQPEFQWRNCSFIDILIAKYRFACPALFGFVGNENTDEGRKRIGWKNDNGKWVSPQEHSERMIGLSAGYAALTLRNYGKTVRQNPYAPHHYWIAIAKIVNTEPERVCATQFTVLKALVENHGEKFANFYGDMAMAALRAAVISFPTRAAEAKNANIAVKSLQVLAEKWENELGFYLK